MKVKVNPQMCSGTGLCEQTCPEVFEIKDGISTVKVVNVPSEVEQSCKQAAQDCPTEAISIEE
jgi:ferredoxin